MNFYTYVLKSERNGQHYYGSCRDLDKRLARHNSGKVRSTKAFRPYKIIYFEQFESRSDAYKQELFFKTLQGNNYLKECGVIKKK